MQESNPQEKRYEKIVSLISELSKSSQNDCTPENEISEHTREILKQLLEQLILSSASDEEISRIYELLSELCAALEVDNPLLEELQEELVELSEEEKQRRHRLMIYEVYKVLNPRQLAGETSIENFINNVIVRGLDEALKYAGYQHSKHFSVDDIEALESHSRLFVDALKREGHHSSGRGR